MNMEQRTRMGGHMIHLQNDPKYDHIVYFEAYPICEWIKMGSNESGINYLDKNGEFIDDFDPDNSQSVFKGSLCWRGVWESRIYFTDNEYWGEDFIELAQIFENKIIPHLKKIIDPNNKYEE